MLMPILASHRELHSRSPQPLPPTAGGQGERAKALAEFSPLNVVLRLRGNRGSLLPALRDGMPSSPHGIQLGPEWPHPSQHHHDAPIDSPGFQIREHVVDVFEFPFVDRRMNLALLGKLDRFGEVLASADNRAPERDPP